MNESKLKLLLALFVVCNLVWLFLFCLMYRQFVDHMQVYHSAHKVAK